MSESPTPNQALLLFGLLARYGEGAQADLVPAVKKADREALERAKLVEAAKVSRRLHLRLSDSGWAWAGANLATDLPPAHRTLQHFLARLAEHLSQTGDPLADFIGRAPEQKGRGATQSEPATPRKPRSRAKPREKTTHADAGQTATPRRPGPAALRKRIETAFLVLTGGRRDESVRLSLLRRELGDLDPAAVDAGLRRILKGDPKASLMRHDDPRQIGKADREASFNPAGEPFHLLWIAS